MHAALIALLVLTTSCATVDGLRDSKGTGETSYYRADRETLLDASVIALRDLGLSIEDVREDEGYVLASQGAGVTSYGEVVGVFVRDLSQDTTVRAVEVVSRKRLATNVFAKSWKDDVFGNLEGQLPVEALLLAPHDDDADPVAQTEYAERDLTFLEPGTRVRVTTETARHVGSYSSTGRDSLAVFLGKSESLSAWALSDLTLVEVSRGKTRGSSTLAAVGGLVGMGIGLVYAANEECDPSGYMGELCTTRWLVIPAVFGTGGLILGWGVGMAFVTGEKWLPVESGSTHPDHQLSMRTQSKGPGLTVGLNLKL
jgi:hypothetical protein